MKRTGAKTTLLHSNIDLEQLCLENTSEYSGLHLVMQLLQDGKKLGWHSKFGELFPDHPSPMKGENKEGLYS